MLFVLVTGYDKVVQCLILASVMLQLSCVGSWWCMEDGVSWKKEIKRYAWHVLLVAVHLNNEIG